MKSHNIFKAVGFTVVLILAVVAVAQQDLHRPPITGEMSVDTIAVTNTGPRCGITRIAIYGTIQAATNASITLDDGDGPYYISGPQAVSNVISWIDGHGAVQWEPYSVLTFYAPVAAGTTNHYVINTIERR